MQTERLDWVDNLRTAVNFLVVNMHACVTYSWVGSWYFNSAPEPRTVEKIPFAFWQAHLQSFFMGLLFFIGGYYADQALGRRSAHSFTVERLRRLGIPTLAYMLILHPFIVLILHPGYAPPSNIARSYLDFVLSGRFIGASGPMWFALALLVFCVTYLVVEPRLPARSSRSMHLHSATVLFFGVTVGCISFLIRTVQPIGTSILNMQLCYFAQYLAAFPLGVWVSRRDALGSIASSPSARRSGIALCVLGPILFGAFMLWVLPLVEKGQRPFEGGWNIYAFVYAVWEQVTGCGLSLGMLYLCSKRLNFATPITKWLSERSFAVYFLHAPILVGITMMVQPIRGSALLMSAIITPVAIIATYGLANLAKLVPTRK